MQAALQGQADRHLPLSRRRWRHVLRVLRVLASLPLAALGLWLLWALGAEDSRSQDPEMIAADARAFTIVLGVGLVSLAAAGALVVAAFRPDERETPWSGSEGPLDWCAVRRSVGPQR